MHKTAAKVKQLVQLRPDAFTSDEAYRLSSLKHAPEMSDVIWEVKRAFEKGIFPEKTYHGASTTYVLKDTEENPLAIFKTDYYRYECVAYRLDRGRFAGVPPTVLTRLDHPLFEGSKLGSCQLFVRGGQAAVEINKKVYEKFLPAPIRKMASLDIRIMNEDRHTSNILVCGTETVPIDHGFILPHDLSQIHFAWVDWSQAETLFTEQERSYISLIDPEEDRSILLNEFRIEEKLANRLYEATILLKLGVEKNMTPASIGRFMARTRPGRGTCSHFELLIEKIKERDCPNWNVFSRHAYEEVERRLDLVNAAGYEINK